VERTLQPQAYVRYVDDFLLFGGDKVRLQEARAAIEEFLRGLRLAIHSGKSRVYTAREGVTFLGWRLFPDRSRLVRGNVVRFRSRLRRIQDRFYAGRMAWPEVEARVRAWIAHASHGETWRLREQVLGQFVFRRGVCRLNARGLVEQQFQEPACGEPQQEPT
jgi:hypothetical protein